LVCLYSSNRLQTNTTRHNMYKTRLAGTLPLMKTTDNR